MNKPIIYAARDALRAVLNHPAFSVERQQLAERMISTTSDAKQLHRWAELALAESERWEDETLAREEAQPGPPAYPLYPY